MWGILFLAEDLLASQERPLPHGDLHVLMLVRVNDL
jgi:hypothetical protein